MLRSARRDLFVVSGEQAESRNIAVPMKAPRFLYETGGLPRQRFISSPSII
jgi:hypothetical protein